VTRIPLLVLAPLFTLLAACSSEEAPASKAAAPSPHLLKVDLVDAVSVLDAKKREPGAEIGVVGRVKHVAKGTIVLVDDSLDYCGESEATMDGCATPWDYCCEDPDEVEAGTIVVKAQTADGKPVAKDQLGVRPLDLVAVRGKLEKDAKGDWSIVAHQGWFRRERPVVGDHVKFVD
jgi:hypothetical protein